MKRNELVHSSAIYDRSHWETVPSWAVCSNQRHFRRSFPLSTQTAGVGKNNVAFSQLLKTMLVALAEKMTGILVCGGAINGADLILWRMLLWGGKGSYDRTPG